MAIFFLRSPNARLLIAVAALVLLSLAAANAAAFLIFRNQLEQQSQKTLAQGERVALRMLGEREQTLEALATVLSRRPTLQRFLDDAAYMELSRFLDHFRIQGNFDWALVCSKDGEILSASNQPKDKFICLSHEISGCRRIDGAPALVVSTQVFGREEVSVVIGRWIDASFLSEVASASALEHGIIDAGSGERLVATWPAANALVPADGGRLVDTNGAPHLVRYVSIDARAPLLLLESALPVSDLVAAERRILVLLAISTFIAAIVLIAVAGLGVRRVNAPVVDALRRSEDAVGAAQAERIAASESLNALIQAIVEGVIMTDEQGIVRFLSSGAERILKLPAGQALGMKIEQLLQPVEGDPFPCEALLAAPGTGQLLDLYTCTGERITVAVSATRIVRPGESGSAYAYLVRDVTEEEAHRRLRSYFLASISHEFRTPLSALRASLELLINEENPLNPAESRQVLRPAYLSLVGLQTLIDNLLTGSAIEAGRFSLHRTEVDMRTILADAVRVVMPLLERRQQPLIVELPARPAFVYGDGAQLTQVVINLLTNASKYSPVGSAVEVSIAVQVDGNKTEAGVPLKIVRVAVADNGPGVEPALRGEIFRRFVRGHDGGREQYGIGLGLYVAKTTILAHGGRIDVENRPGGGALFWFELNAL
ncbi:MAG: ATP-binding protein [Caldilinea sp.]|nr:ATP-binding protein [Caldilinea sp.]MDW8442167.1 ATP-binding protein [Caldilineaceae bacterium]